MEIVKIYTIFCLLLFSCTTKNTNEKKINTNKEHIISRNTENFYFATNFIDTNDDDRKELFEFLKLINKRLVIFEIRNDNKDYYEVKVIAPINPHFLFENNNLTYHFFNERKNRITLGLYVGFENFNIYSRTLKMHFLKNAFPDQYDYFIKNGELGIPNTGNGIVRTFKLRKKIPPALLRVNK